MTNTIVLKRVSFHFSPHSLLQTSPDQGSKLNSFLKKLNADNFDSCHSSEPNIRSAKIMNQLLYSGIAVPICARKYLLFEIDLKVFTVRFVAFADLQHGQTIFKANSKIRQLLIGFFYYTTFTTENQSRLSFSARLNSTRHVIYARPCVCREIMTP